MKSTLFNVLTIAILTFASSPFCFAQVAPTLGAADKFALFTNAGDFANTGATTVTGDIGVLVGDETGTQVTLSGTEHFTDTEAGLAAAAVTNAYAVLTDNISNPCGPTPLLSPIGGGTTLLAGVHCSTTATELTGNLTLDGEDDPNAIFIIKIGGALSVTAPVNIILTGGTQLKNVFWQVTGAFNLGAGANFKGTMINLGAINLASGSSISGRALSTAGTITLDNAAVSNAEVSLPVTLLSFAVRNGENHSALLEWATTAEKNSDRFEIERSVTGKNWSKISTIDAKGESRELAAYSFSDLTPEEGINLYRLKMIDQDETFAYSRIRNVNIESGIKTVMYPNPSSGKLTLEVNDLSKIERVQFNDFSGKLLLEQKKVSASNMSLNFNVGNFPSGLYFVRVTHTNGSVDVLKIVKR